MESVHTCTGMTAGKQNMKIAWLVQGRKMFIPFPRMQADDRKETLENRNTWFQIKYLHEIFSFPAALCELSTLPEERASWQELRLGTNKPLHQPIEDLTQYQLAGSRRGARSTVSWGLLLV